MKQYNQPLILLVDDEKAILKTLQDAITDEGYRVKTLSEGQKALETIGKIVPDLVLLDIFMPNCNGLEILTQIKREYPDQKVIIISGFGNISIAIEAIKKGALDFIEKPLNLDEILAKINILRTPTTQAEPTADKDGLQACGIVGASNLFLELISQAERLAPHMLTILINGEYGTGKSTLAYYIHKKSHLAQFITTDCELQQDFSVFGKTTPCTVYLKHVDTLDRAHQQALLQVVAQNNIHRIIASSRTPLFNLVKAGAFNETLFYHLNKAPLEVPPLRKRPYDIPLLVNHYINKYNAEAHKHIVLATQSIRFLRNYAWPANIAELKNTMQHIVLCNKESHTVVTIQDLACILGEKKVSLLEEQSLLHFASLDEAVTTFKKNFLLYLLKKNHYNIDEVASNINLSPVQLKHTLLELKINI